MKRSKFSFSSLFRRLLRRREPVQPVPSPPAKSMSARERVRSGIEPLEGRIAPAILISANTLTFNDSDGDLVMVKFSKGLFDLNSATLSTELDNVFKFSAGKAHAAPANATDDVNQQLQLIDLGRISAALASRVQGVSFTITAEQRGGGDGFANVGAIRTGANSLGVVRIDGDLAQIDAGTSANKVGLAELRVQSIGKLGLTTQGATLSPDLESRIVGRLGQLEVADDVSGYVHVVDSATQRGTIGNVIVGGSLRGSLTVGTASDNTGRIEASFDINSARIGTNFADGILGGAGDRSGSLSAGHLIKSVVVSGDVRGGTGDGGGTIESLGNIERVTIRGNVVGADGAGSGAITAGGQIQRVVIDGQLDGGRGANSGSILAGLDPSRSLRDLGDVTIRGAMLGDEGAGSGSIAAGGSMGAIEVGESLSSGLAARGGLGALSGAIFAGRGIESVNLARGVEGGAGPGSASIQAHGTIGRVDIGGDFTGGTGAESASIQAHEIANLAKPISGNIGRVTIAGKLDGVGERSALIHADGTLGRASMSAMEGGAGGHSGAIISGAGLLKAGPTTSITVTGVVESGAGAGSGTIEIGSRLGALTVGGLDAAQVRVADDLGALTVNGAVTDSFISARGQAIAGRTSDLAIGSIRIVGDVAGSRIFAGHDVLGDAVNGDAQIGRVRVDGGWTASTLLAGTAAGDDTLFGTADDESVGAGRASIVARIASVVIAGSVEGTSGSGDHFGFIAESIGSFSSNGTPLSLTGAAGQSFELGTNTDVTVREVV